MTDPTAPIDLTGCPARLEVGPPDHQAAYKRRADLFAHAQIAGTAPLMLVDGDRLAIDRGVPSADHRSVAPVYEGPAGEIAVATGRVFVRFSQDSRARHHDEDLRKAGYAISDVPGYAPHAAWVEAATGSVADGLSGLARLRSIRGVESVEPQLLRPLARR